MTPAPSRTRRRPAGWSRRATILVVYYADRWPVRTALADHLYALGRYADAQTFYLNAAVRSVPRWVDRLGLDLIVFHTSLLAQRWHPPTFQRLRRQLERLRPPGPRKVALPQDEFIHTDALVEFLSEFGVDHVLTCAAPPDLPTIYGSLANGPMVFSRVLTGYIDPRSVSRIERLGSRRTSRSIDIAYRAWRPEFWLGRHAQLKGEIAERVEVEARRAALRTDISLRDEDTLVGDAWYRLLLDARWTIGVEGGASILDRDGSLRERTQAYVRTHPSARFEEVEAACFPNRDGELGLMAISPRHLEACATRTAQILVEGEYNGILEPDIHYLPLRRDFSNVADIVSRVSDDGLRNRLANRAYDDVVASHAYDFRVLAEAVLRDVTVHSKRLGATDRLVRAWEGHLDRLSWALVVVRQWLRPPLKALVARIGLLDLLRRVRDGWSGGSN